MNDNYKIAIVGNKDTILGFKALGLKTFDANSKDDALKVLTRLVNEEIQVNGENRKAYAIIFVTEDLAKDISKDEYKKLSISTLPAIVPIPGSQGTTGYGIKRIGKMVEQAVGSDIFKDN